MQMLKVWAEQPWEDYLHWQDTDKKNVKKINRLIKEIERHPFTGLGKPEPLKHDWTGYWSRQITEFPSGKAHGFNRGLIARSDTECLV